MALGRPLHGLASASGFGMVVVRQYGRGRDLSGRQALHKRCSQPVNVSWTTWPHPWCWQVSIKRTWRRRIPAEVDETGQKEQNTAFISPIHATTTTTAGR